MSTRTFGRIGVAAILAVGLLAATAAPSSAVAHTFSVDPSSTFVVKTSTGSTVVNQHFKSHSITNICAPNSTPPSTVPIDLNSTGGGTVGAATTGWSDFVVGPNTYKSRVNILGGSISVTHTSLTVAWSMSMEIRTCDSQTTLCLTNPIAITMTGANPTPSNLHPGVSTTMNVSGISGAITTAAGCNLILRAALQGNFIHANLGLHVTS